MILVYASNSDLGKVADYAESLKKEGKRFSYRNPRYFDKPEDCDGVYIVGDWPEVRDAYDNILSGEDYPIPDESGSWYTLSNGERVNGEANAIEAQKALDNG